MIKTTTFNKRFEDLISKTGLNPVIISRETGIPEGTLSRYKNGKRSASTENIEILAEYFKVPIAWIMGYDETEETDKIHIPLIGSIAAGIPVLAQQNIEDYYPVPASWKINYILQVRGDSMIEAGIPSGSYVGVRSQNEVENGEIAVCVIDDDDATLKRFTQAGNVIILHPENSSLPDKIFEGREKKRVKIQGVAKVLIKNL